MKLTEQEIKEIYRRGTARPARREECLTEEQLSRLARGDSSDQERISAARHMMRCSDCSEEYRIARSTRSWAGQFDDLPEPSATRPSLWAIFSMQPLSYSAAALLLITTVSLAAWVSSLRREAGELQARVDQQAAELDRAGEASRSLEQARREIEEAARRSEQYQSKIDELKKETAELAKAIQEKSRPNPNDFIVDLSPDDSVRGGDQKPARTIDVPSYSGGFTLNLNLTEQPSHTSYEMEVFNQSGSLIHRARGLKVTSDNTSATEIPARLMPDGQYRIKLFGLGKSARTLVEDYRMRIRRR